jgi:hypothetical protein
MPISPKTLNAIQAAGTAAFKADAQLKAAIKDYGSLTNALLVNAVNKPIRVLNPRDGQRALLAAGNHAEALLRKYVMGIGYQ